MIHGAVQTVDVTADGVPGLVAQNRGHFDTCWLVLDFFVTVNPILSDPIVQG